MPSSPSSSLATDRGASSSPQLEAGSRRARGAYDAAAHSGFTALLRHQAAERAAEGRHGSPVKRALDIAGALTGLVILMPVLLAITMALVISGHRPLFVHRRLGVGGRTFPCLKFRTMHADAEERLLWLLATDERAKREWTSDQKLSSDPRITTVGRYLRRTNLDELPQLLNVLVGQMSLVGPRPIVADEVMRFGTLYPLVALARPGMTGLWQVSGRHRLSYAERVDLDLHYVKNSSLRVDVRIIVTTVWQTLLTLFGSTRFGGA